MAAMNFYRRLACDKGAELIEFALVFPLLLLVMFGIMDFGLLFQRYETVTNAAREGARIAVLPGYAQADVEARVNQYLAASGLTAPPTIAYTARQAVNVGGACVTITGVTVDYPYQYLFIGKHHRTIRRLWIQNDNADRHREDAVRRCGIGVPLADYIRRQYESHYTNIGCYGRRNTYGRHRQPWRLCGRQEHPVREVEVAHTFVAVAARNLPTGSRITEEDVKLVAWPAGILSLARSRKSSRSWTAALWRP